jgi:trigger factor
MKNMTKNEDSSITLTITIPWADVAKAHEDVVVDMVKNAEIDGFRKGKAPRKIVEERLDKSKVYEEVLKTIIPAKYDEAVKEADIQPIILPKIELVSAKENEEWTVKATTAERPEVKLGEYKKAVAEMKAGKQKKIWVPGADEKADKTKEASKPTLDEILTAVAGAVTVTIPSLLTEQEVTRMLSELIDQTKKIGVTVDQYLASTNRTIESLKAEYEAQAKLNITLEFALETIAETEKVTVEASDIDAVLKNAKTPEERETMEKQKYYLASVIRRQKTIAFLASL